MSSAQDLKDLFESRASEYREGGRENCINLLQKKHVVASKLRVLLLSLTGCVAFSKSSKLPM